jgi:hypothetical protein
MFTISMEENKYESLWEVKTIEKYLHLLDNEVIYMDSKKKNNIRFHLLKQAKAKKFDDSQLLLFTLLIDTHINLERAEIIRDEYRKGSSDYYPVVLQEMKEAIEKKDNRPRKIVEYDTMENILQDDINNTDKYYREYEDLIWEYHRAIGVLVPNFRKTYNETAEDLCIYSKKSYIQLMKDLEEDIKKSCGVATMRLEQYKQEYLKNKELKQFI